MCLDDFRFPAVGRGDEIIMRRTLPEDWELVEGTLRLSIRHSAVSVLIDDESIFEFGYDRVARNKTVGSGFEFINFPNTYQGRELTIFLYPAENRLFTRLDPVRIYPWENAYRALMTENRLPLFLGGFLLIFGLAAFHITELAIVFSRKYLRLLCVSAFFVCMGFWTLCYYRVVSVYAIPLYAISLVEYIAFYLAPLPLIVYMYEDVKKLRQKPLQVIYWVLLAAHILALAVMTTLHARDIVHFAAMLPFVVGIIVACLIFFSVVILLNFKSSRAENRLYLTGMFIIVCCTTYDLIGYGSDRLYGDSRLMRIKGVSSIGVMLFIFILFLTFYVDMTRKMMQEAERNSLIKSAYTDELTKLYNRRYCMEYMGKLREEKRSDYAVVCFDLNNLKKVNDTMGHAQGDVLIRSAAEVLAETFDSHGIVARMGGDEFLAVVNTSDPGRMAELMELFQRNVARKNGENGNLHLSIACGYAFGKESGQDIEKVYQEADNRMYENKKQIKKGLCNALPN